MKGIFKCILVLSLVLAVMSEVEEEESHMSELIMRLLDKYDSENKGSIPREFYPDFIVDVFVEGNPEIILPETLDLLREAATEFSAKYDKTNSVDTHQFFNDIIVDFTTFLMKNEDKYMDVLTELYYDREEEEEELEDVSNEEEDEDHFEEDEFQDEEHSFEL